ncbi:MAG: HPF/RaiA family ribosome-associated protein [Gemmatimonadaceae bacterium]
MLQVAEADFVEIVFQSHKAAVSEQLRGKARTAITKLARRLRRTVDATVRFERDGPTRRVEIVLRAPRNRLLVAEARARQYSTALDRAIDHLAAQTNHAKRPAKRRGRRTARV